VVLLKLFNCLQKRRSGRNVKRKRYVESVDLSFSGDDEDGEVMRQSKKNQQIVELSVSSPNIF